MRVGAISNRPQHLQIVFGLIESTPFASQSQPALRATCCYVVDSNLFANFLVLMEYALRD